MRLRLFPASYRFFIATLICCTVAFLTVFAAPSSEKDKATAVDPAVYKEFMSNEVFGVEDLDQWFVDQQFNWLPLMPPAEDFILRQPSGQVLPFDSKQFPPEFVKSLTPSYLNTVPAYRLTIVEDPKTRQTLFFNEKGQQVFALQPVPGYDPLWFLKDYRPDLFSGHYTPWYVDFMSRLYDPSHVQAEVTLIPGEYSEYYLYAEQLIAQEAATLALASGSGGGSILMRYDGPPVTNICFTAIERTNGVRVTIAYPYNGATYPTNCFTNRLDVFTSSDLLESWWELAVTTNVSPTTNWIEWSDASVTNPWATPRFYAAGNADLDSDGDGFADAREIFMYHSDPNDSTSKPVSVSGAVSYSGTETGTIYALATTSTDGWSLGCSTAMSGPGSYSNSEVATLRSYWFKAFRDVNVNLARDSWEPWGIYSSSSTYVTSSLSGVNITLSDVPTIWGTISYTGSKTGNVYIIAVTASNSWDTTYSCMIPWVQGDSSMTGGATTYLTFPVGYSITGLPASNYWIRAFIDSDTNLAYTHLEAAGQYTSNAIPISNRVTGINFTLDQDSDNDTMPDWWEWQYGFNPADSNDALLDRDSDAAPNWKEYLFDINPDIPDSDGDGMPDGWEIQYGLAPANSNDAAQDMDNDGLNNLDEYRRGTYPNNPDSDNDLISDGTNSLAGIFAGPDPNPLTPAPGNLALRYITAVGRSIVAKEDRRGRPVVAWLANDTQGRAQVFAMQWFGAMVDASPDNWPELSGKWEQFGGSSVNSGLTTAAYGVFSFDMALDRDDSPVVAWVEQRTSNACVCLLRWSITNWQQVGNSYSNGIATALVNSYQTQTISNFNLIGINGVTNGTVLYYTITNWFDRCAVAVDTQNLPVVASLRPANPTAIQVRRFNGTNWVGLGNSATDSGITGQGDYFNPLIAVGTDNRPVVTYWAGWAYYCRKWDGTSSWPNLGSTIGQVDGTNVAYDLCSLALNASNTVHFGWLQYRAKVMSNNVLLPPKHGFWVRRFTGGAWGNIGSSATGIGLHKDISAEISARSLSIDCRGTGETFAVWSQWDGVYSPYVFARRAQGTNWFDLGSSFTNTGINYGGASVNAVAGLTAQGSPVALFASQWSGSSHKLQARQFMADSDGDGLSDNFEIAHGLNSTTNDTDSDGLTDFDEWMFYGTSATTNDTDGDGLTDGQEVLGTKWGVPSNPLLADSDGDGINDGIDVFVNSPYGDQDGDGISDAFDPDADNDGAATGTNTNSDLTVGCPYYLNADSDNDGYMDGVEISAGSDPCDSNSVPADVSPPAIFIIEPKEGATL